MTTLEDFGDFVLIKVDAVHFGSDQAKQCSHHLQQLTNSNHQLIFLDFGLTRDADASSLNLLTSEIASLKSKRSGAEVILISEPHLSSSLQASALLQQVKLYSREDESIRIQITQNVLTRSERGLQSAIDSALEQASSMALKRWTGEDPSSVGQAKLTANPLTDIVSRVNVNVDGCIFHVYLSAGQNTLQQLVSKILARSVSITETVVSDGACELLNYMSAYLKQNLTAQESIVEADPPALMEVEELMVVLSQDRSCYRVTTNFGYLEVWAEAVL